MLKKYIMFDAFHHIKFDFDFFEIQIIYTC